MKARAAVIGLSLLLTALVAPDQDINVADRVNHEFGLNLSWDPNP